ncbi:MAG: hypothetical protein ABI207_05105, partial [Crocinitomicaceae bacterium]
PVVNLGESTTSTAKIQFQGFIGEANENIYGVESQFNGGKLKDLYLSKYDKKSLKSIFSKGIIPAETAQFTFSPIEIFTLKDTAYLICVATDKSTKERLISVNPVSKDGELGATHFLGSIPIQSTAHEDFSVVIDQEEKRFLVVRYFSYEMNEHQKIELTAYNTDLSTYWKDTVDFPDNNDDFLFDEFQFNGEDKIVFLAKSAGGINAVSQSKNLLENNTYFLFSFEHGNKQLKEIELKLKEKWIRAITFEFGLNDIVVGGYFSNNSAEQIDGVFSIMLNNLFEISHATIQSFLPEDLKPFYPRSKAHDETSLTDFMLKEILQLPSGYFAIVGEQFYKEMRPSYDPRMNISTSSDLYNYNYILVSLYDPNGKLVKHVCVPKYQSTTNDNGYYSSFIAGKSADHFFFFFNDTKRNEGLKNEDYLAFKMMDNYRNNAIFLVDIDTNAVVSRKIVIEDAEENMFVPQLSEQLLDGICYLFSQNGNNYRMATVDFKK